MTGSLQSKKQKSGKTYFYIILSYKNSKTNRWCQKSIATNLEIKGNKRKADTMITDYVKKYSYLEQSASELSLCDFNVNVSDYMDYWYATIRSELRYTTRENYSSKVEHIKKYFDEKKQRVIDVTPQTVDCYIKYLLHYGKINQKTKAREPLAPRTVRDYKNILSAAFMQATIDGIIRFNPVIGINVHGKKNSEYSEELLFLTEEEIKKLMNYLAKNSTQLLGIAFFAIYYGLRRSEILGLKWNAIDFQKKTIAIQHTIVKAKTLHAEDKTKTRSSRRTLTLFQSTEQCLSAIRKEQESNKAFYKNCYKNTNGYIFTWEDGALYDPGYISKAFCKATRAIGRPEITLHKLRHTCASILISKGWDVKAVQYWLGHSDIKTTLNIYAHFNRNRLNTEINPLADLSLQTVDLFSA